MVSMKYRILKLCLKGFLSTSYYILAEVAFNSGSVLSRLEVLGNLLHVIYLAKMQTSGDTVKIE